MWPPSSCFFSRCATFTLLNPYTCSLADDGLAVPNLGVCTADCGSLQAGWNCETVRPPYLALISIGKAVSELCRQTWWKPSCLLKIFFLSNTPSNELVTLGQISPADVTFIIRHTASLIIWCLAFEDFPYRISGRCRFLSWKRRRRACWQQRSVWPFWRLGTQPLDTRWLYTSCCMGKNALLFGCVGVGGLGGWECNAHKKRSTCPTGPLRGGNCCT
jgi:hypothetical protein